ncbi:amino acid ABC transporter substrate-binding protein [Bacillus sp. mrc49]|uniref:amino acid ABC transporter substrate-binding protein n=1 Tax=Bacillus sp. mrc49 TaxID=2054913 RepID=UPI000C26FC1E|nr:amino acid ABC transporter substrate-binding protein [Bacillus sp. mrc49]PJN90490.1 amino acid ABC transporter substrate-binding protein [Bacillus sp. mrc49]
MKKFLFLGLSILFIVMLSACGSSKQGNTADDSGKKTIKVGSTGQSYPNGYQENGKLTGFDVELTERIAKNLGYKVEWVTSDFSGIMGQLGSGKLDTVANAVAITTERQEQFHFTDPYSYYGAQIVSNTKNKEIKSLEDLKGKTVSGVLGSNNIANLEKYDKKGEIKIRTYETRDGAMQDAINNRVDGYINSRPILVAEIKKNDLPLKLVGDPVAYENVGYPFPKTEKGKKLNEEFTTEIKKLKEDGTLAKLSNKYFGEDITTKSGE